MIKVLCKQNGKISGYVFLQALVCIFLFHSFSCMQEDAEAPQVEEDEEVLSVFVNIPPQKWLVEQIGRELVDVNVLVPPGSDPHVFTPTPSEVMRLGNADIYFHGIMPFGRELARRVGQTGVDIRIVNITSGVEFRDMQQHCHDHEHNHDAHEHDHEHQNAEGKDPHVWLSPPELKVQARNIADALRAADRDNKDRYDANLARFIAAADAVHKKLQEMLAPYRGRTFYVFHPAFGYFARSYGLTQEAVETGGRSPTPRHLRNLISEAREEGVKIIFVHPQFESKSAEIVADGIGGEVVMLDPLAGDVLANLVKIGESIADALGEGDQND